jgi:Helix-turn-helix domain
VHEYLTIAKGATLLRIAPKIARNKIAAGLFPPGVVIRRRGVGTRFKRSALIEWLESESHPTESEIPMARRAKRAAVARVVADGL